MNVRSQVVVRPLDAAHVSAILGIISACRREYGLEGRVDSILERADYEILDVYRRERSRYFVAVIDGGDDDCPCILCRYIHRRYIHRDCRFLE